MGIISGKATSKHPRIDGIKLSRNDGLIRQKLISKFQQTFYEISANIL